MTPDPARAAGPSEGKVPLEAITLSDAATLRDCIVAIRDTHTGVVVFADDGGRLSGIITIGDIVRILADGGSLDMPVAQHVNRNPRVLSNDLTDDEVRDAMAELKFTVLPMVDATGRIVRMATVADLLKDRILDYHFVVMAGGEGRRLYPLTEEVPKPMLEIGGQPILERIIRSAKSSGLRDVTIAVRYKSEIIKRHFGDGRKWGIRIRYLEEGAPMGTCGALSLLERVEKPIMLMNSDILASIDFKDLARFHEARRSMATVVVKKHHTPVPFGVVTMEGDRLIRMDEKPDIARFINAGIYVFEPAALARIPRNARFDSTQLISALLDSGEPVLGYRLDSTWFDIGTTSDFYTAKALIESRQESAEP